jgi:hypothetical protein
MQCSSRCARTMLCSTRRKVCTVTPGLNTEGRIRLGLQIRRGDAAWGKVLRTCRAGSVESDLKE